MNMQQREKQDTSCGIDKVTGNLTTYRELDQREKLISVYDRYFFIYLIEST